MPGFAASPPLLLTVHVCFSSFPAPTAASYCNARIADTGPRLLGVFCFLRKTDYLLEVQAHSAAPGLVLFNEHSHTFLADTSRVCREPLGLCESIRALVDVARAAALGDVVSLADRGPVWRVATPALQQQISLTGQALLKRSRCKRSRNEQLRPLTNARHGDVARYYVRARWHVAVRDDAFFQRHALRGVRCQRESRRKRHLATANS